MSGRPPIDLFVAGAGPAYTDRVGATGAAYLLRSTGTTILLDLGQGSFPRVASELDPGDLDAVVVSHLHPDHFIDLVSLRHYLRYECVPARRCTVYGPRAIGDRLDALHAEPGFASAALDVVPLAVGARRIGAFVLETGLVTHTEESYGFRLSSPSGGDAPIPRNGPVEPGAGLVYSGDCGRAADLVPLIRRGDVLLTEVSFGPGPVPAGAQHLDGPAVGRLAATTGVSRVLLTHLQMGFDPEDTIASVRAECDVEVRFVWPGDRLAI